MSGSGQALGHSDMKEPSDRLREDGQFALCLHTATGSWAVMQVHMPERRAWPRGWEGTRGTPGMCLPAGAGGPCPTCPLVPLEKGRHRIFAGCADLGRRKSLTAVCLVQNDGFHQTTNPSQIPNGRFCGLLASAGP